MRARVRVKVGAGAQCVTVQAKLELDSPPVNEHVWHVQVRMPERCL